MRRTAFPTTSVWNTIPDDFLLIGKQEPTPIDLTLLKKRYETNSGIQSDLQRPFRIPQDWPGVLGYFTLGESDVARLAEGAGVNTDDRLPLEFSTPRTLYTDTMDQNWQLVRSFQTAELPQVTEESRAELKQADVRYWIGVSYLTRGLAGDALHHFRVALQLDPDHIASMHAASRASLDLNQPAEALDLARHVIAREPLNADANYLAGVAAAALNRKEQARGFLSRAVSLQPEVQDYQEVLKRIDRRGASQEPVEPHSDALVGDRSRREGRSPTVPHHAGGSP